MHEKSNPTSERKKRWIFQNVFWIFYTECLSVKDNFCAFSVPVDGDLEAEILGDVDDDDDDDDDTWYDWEGETGDFTKKYNAAVSNRAQVRFGKL